MNFNSLKSNDPEEGLISADKILGVFNRELKSRCAADSAVICTGSHQLIYK